MHQTKISKLPIILIASFNFLTLLIYIGAPYVFYYGENIYASYVYIIINILLLIAGYLFGSKKGLNNYHTKYNVIDFNLSRGFLYLTLFYTITFLIKYAYLLKFQINDIAGMIQHLSVGVINPKMGYQLSIDESRKHTINWSLYFLISIINNFYFVIGFISWEKISNKLKIAFIFFLCLEVFYWIGRGTNFGIISLFLSLLFSSIVKNKGAINNIIILKYISIFILSIISFSLIMYSRSEGSVYDLQYLAIPQTYIDENSLAILMTPTFLHTTILTISSYIVQGYYNMSVAFLLDFQPSWFCGWNPAVTSFCLNFGFDFSSQTYIDRLDSLGIDPRINWHSSYTWFANDFSFYGAPFVILLIGYLIGFSWSKAIIANNNYSKIVFVSLSSSAILFFANNNYIGYHFYSFMFLIPIWFFSNFVRIK